MGSVPAAAPAEAPAPKETTVSGRVTCQETGQPIAGAKVTLFIWQLGRGIGGKGMGQQDLPHIIGKSSTDAGGNYRLGPIGHADVAITVQAPGHAPYHSGVEYRLFPHFEKISHRGREPFFWPNRAAVRKIPQRGDASATAATA